jgi:hypothetical protein
MCALPLEAARPHASPVPRVISCERVDVGARSTLVRVTVDLEPRRAADAQLVVLIDGARERRQRALPANAGARTDAGASFVTLGFAVTRRAELVALELGGRRLRLPAPLVRSSAAVTLAATAVAPPPATASRETVEEQLRATQERLEEACAARARLEGERDRAREAATRAEAAAHDATARAEALAGAMAPPAPIGGDRRRSPRRAAAAACAIGSAVVVCGVLVWPGGDGAGSRGVSDVSAATPAAAAGVTRTPAVFDPLAQRLQIPSSYLTLYRQAGARYGLDWTRLAAIGAIESHHGQSAAAGVISGANRRGASGPAQFLAGTWERFGVDGDGDGDLDPHDPADAIAAMASYLRASGAPQDWRGALRSYNHSDAYATSVEHLAATYRRGAD